MWKAIALIVAVLMGHQKRPLIRHSRSPWLAESVWRRDTAIPEVVPSLAGRTSLMSNS